MLDFDVIVIGGGIAGCTSALACSKAGFNVLMLEKESYGRHKPCGGVMPTAGIDAFEEIGLNIPESVMSSPKSLGLMYVPPSGRKNSGSLRNYELLNLNRDRFDKWLQDSVMKSENVEVCFDSDFLSFDEKKEGLVLLIKTEGQVDKFTARYLVGADGVHSKIRKILYPNFRAEIIIILQEHWQSKGDFGDFFHVFLDGNITPTYGYVIPKKDEIIIGTGSLPTFAAPASACLSNFKEWLSREFAFEPLKLNRKSAAAVPFGYQAIGKGRVILTGDAAGFCNAFTGEGIRLAAESGIEAGRSIQQAENRDVSLSEIYEISVEGLKDVARATHEYAINMTQERREEFVKTEINRLPFTTNK